jgi:hypothetical protein
MKYYSFVDRKVKFDVVLTVPRRYYVEMCPVCGLLSSPQTGHTTLNSTLYRQLENQAPNTTDYNHMYNTLELLMMGIKVPETC